MRMAVGGFTQRLIYPSHISPLLSQGIRLVALIQLSPPLNMSTMKFLQAFRSTTLTTRMFVLRRILTTRMI
jgi:hypothetical protein